MLMSPRRESDDKATRFSLEGLDFSPFGKLIIIIGLDRVCLSREGSVKK